MPVFLFFLLQLQLADAKDVMKAIRNVEGVRFPVLTPNLKVSTFWCETKHYKLLIRRCETYSYCVELSYRDLRRLLLLVQRKLPSLPQLLSLFQNQI